MQLEFICSIYVPSENESAIASALAGQFPSFAWVDGDSSWDKIRVSGNGEGTTIGIFRKEGPGPFQLSVLVSAPEGSDPKPAYLALRERVFRALSAQLWDWKESPSAESRYSPAYEFESTLDILAMKDALAGAGPWPWTLREQRLSGRQLLTVIRVCAYDADRYHHQLLIVRAGAGYRIEVGFWKDPESNTVTCEQVHAIVQQQVLPAIRAVNIRGVQLFEDE